MRQVLQVLDVAARLGMATGLVLIALEMHRANGPAVAQDAELDNARYMQTAEREEAPKKAATLADIDQDLRRINATLASVATNVLERH